MLEGHDFDAEFLPVFLHGELGVVGSVEIFALGVFAGASVIAADDEVRRAMIFADNGVPDCFSRPAHSHG